MPSIHYKTSGCTVDFDEGEEVNLLRMAIKRECGVPFRCASGNCGTDRVLIEAGAEHLSPIRPKERDRLGDDIDKGYRLACQTYTTGDVVLSWDAEQTGTASERLRQKWLSGEAEQQAQARGAGGS